MVASAVFALVLAAMALSSRAGPLNKRIAQTISASTAQWEKACQAAGGAEQCNPLSQTAFMTLLAAAGPCDQQNAADSMIDLAKTLNNDADMIKFTQIFVQQPRNSPDSFSIPYCQQAPKNSELNGLFQCQFQGTKDTFVGNLQPGAQGTVPFGLTSLATPKSCPANPQGGVADGTQLVDITQDPGLNNINSSSGDSASGNSSSSDSSSGSTDSSTGTSSVDTSDATETSAAAASTAEPAACTVPSSTETSAASGTASGNNAASSSGSSSFILQNGKDAQALNVNFQTLTADASCSTGDTACIDGKFALCNNGAFVLMDCGSTVCAAVPLVNKAGTSVTCLTEQEAIQRIQDTGATGGLTGSD